MIAVTLSTNLDRRAGELLAAAQFTGSAESVRAARIVGTAATVARAHGLSGVEGYLVAVEALGTPADATASRIVRVAVDAALEELAFAAWSGRLARLEPEPVTDGPDETADTAEKADEAERPLAA